MFVQPLSPNYFDKGSVAERYALGRPYLHPQIIQRIRQFVDPVDYVLDVACGTGMSSVALLDIADRIVGIDLSREMLAQASRHPRINYVAGEAEALPVGDGSVGLVSVALAYHWLDRRRFLAEARRALRDGGWLIVYNTWFTGDMEENAAFGEWWSQEYLVRYPTPRRRSQLIAEHDASAAGFQLLDHSMVDIPVRFSLSELRIYLTTQSNVIAAVEKGESLESVRDWLNKSLSTQFHAERPTFRFCGEVWMFRSSRSA